MIVKVAKGPISPSSGGTGDGMSKIAYTSTGVDMIVFPLLAMLWSKGKVNQRQSPILNEVCRHPALPLKPICNRSLGGGVDSSLAQIRLDRSGCCYRAESLVRSYR